MNAVVIVLEEKVKDELNLFTSLQAEIYK